MKKTIIILFILFYLFSSNSFAQVGLLELGGNRYLNSVFERYVRPNFSSQVKCYFDSVRIDNLLNRCYDCAASYTFIIILRTNIDSTVGYIDVMPVEELFFNQEKLPDYILKSIIESIKTVSKHWILKPKLFKLRDDKNKEEKEIIIELNKESKSRPSFGRKNVFILYEIKIADSRLNGFDEILFIDEPY